MGKIGMYVSLLAEVRKLYAKAKIDLAVESTETLDLCGVRKDRSSSVQIFAVRKFREKMKEEKKLDFLAFKDLEITEWTGGLWQKFEFYEI